MGEVRHDGIGVNEKAWGSTFFFFCERCLSKASSLFHLFLFLLSLLSFRASSIQLLPAARRDC